MDQLRDQIRDQRYKLFDSETFQLQVTFRSSMLHMYFSYFESLELGA
jgi:hypothetical protein